VVQCIRTVHTQLLQLIEYSYCTAYSNVKEATFEASPFSTFCGPTLWLLPSSDESFPVKKLDCWIVSQNFIRLTRFHLVETISQTAKKHVPSRSQSNDIIMEVKMLSQTIQNKPALKGILKKSSYGRIGRANSDSDTNKRVRFPGWCTCRWDSQCKSSLSLKLPSHTSDDASHMHGQVNAVWKARSTETTSMSTQSLRSLRLAVATQKKMKASKKARQGPRIPCRRSSTEIADVSAVILPLFENL
jgi:hypothetical protein